MLLSLKDIAMQQIPLAPSTRPASKLSTEEVAAALLVLPQTVRRSFCTLGHFHGLRPTKLASRRLAWDAAEVDRLIAGEAAKAPDPADIAAHQARKASSPAKLPAHIARKAAAKAKRMAAAGVEELTTGEVA